MFLNLSLSLRWWRQYIWVIAGVFVASTCVGVSAEKPFDIPEGYANESLRQVALQGEIQIGFSDTDVEGVRTPVLHGRFSPELALNQLLDGTPLTVVQAYGKGAFVVLREDHDVENPIKTQTPETPIIQETEMNNKKNNWLKSLAAALTLGIVSGPSGLNGQEDDHTEPVFDLSPFTVDASEDTGYSATSTLAGTRIRTDLKDLGASISVVTSQLMEDIAATDAGTLLSYTANTEVGGLQGNFSGGETNVEGRVMLNDARTNPQFNQRVRGLGNADLTRGYFITDIPFDSFNTDRVTVSRGPNSLLFGIGSPGGVINTGLKRPIQNTNFGEIKVRFDNYGSVRSEIDFNRSIADGRITLRIAVLVDDAEFKQEPAWNKDERFYGALDIVLLENENSDLLDATRLRINGETGISKGSPVEIIPPSIAYHGWFEPTPTSIQQFTGSAPPPNVVSPSEGGTWEYQTTYNPFLVEGEGGINTNVHPSTFRLLSIYYNEADAAQPLIGTPDGIQGIPGLAPWNRNRDTLDSTSLAGTAGALAAFGPGAPGNTPVGPTTDFHTNSPYSQTYAIGPRKISSVNSSNQAESA